MRWALLIGALTLVALVLTFMFGLRMQTPWASLNFSPHFTTCYGGPEVPGPDRAALEEAALSFTRTLLGPEPGRAFTMMSRAGQAEASEAGVADGGRSLQSTPSRADLTIERTYLVTAIGGAGSERWAMCSGAEGQDLVRVGGASREGHVLITDTIDGGARSVAVWLVFEGGAWRVNGAQSDMSALMGRNGQDLWRLAREEKRAGHHVNAFVLHEAAESLLRRGGYVQLSAAREMEAAAGEYLPPEEARQRPWEIGGDAFDITRVSYHGSVADQKVSLMIDHTMPNWTDDAVAERRNQQLIAAFAAAYPEWETVFDAIVARAASDARDTTWGTVFLKGSNAAPAAAAP